MQNTRGKHPILVQLRISQVCYTYNETLVEKNTRTLHTVKWTSCKCELKWWTQQLIANVGHRNHQEGTHLVKWWECDVKAGDVWDRMTATRPSPRCYVPLPLEALSTGVECGHFQHYHGSRLGFVAPDPGWLPRPPYLHLRCASLLRLNVDARIL